MRLKRLVARGFKSFADRTEFEFDSRLTGIIGPNGCGKSNVVDAIKWVLGDQRARSLRGSEMTDVIFKGAEGRERMGMAEVTITFEDDEGRFEGRSEIDIARRLTLEKESSYLLNGEEVRLKDVRETLFGTGLGTGGYSVMEQGRIDAVLSANPEARRAIFEEAAGIARFKLQKRESLRKLERTDQNLSRVTDLLEERARRIRSLKIQAGKARRWQLLEGELRDLRAAVAVVEGTELRRVLAQQNEQLAELEAGRDSAEQARDQAQVCVKESEAGIARCTVALETARSELHESRGELTQHQERGEAQRQRAADLGGEAERGRQRIANLQAQQAERAEELRGSRDELVKCEAELIELHRRLEEQRELTRKTQSRLRDLQERRERVRELLLELLHGRTRARNAAADQEALITASRVRGERLRARHEVLDQEQQELVREESSQQAELDDVHTRERILQERQMRALDDLRKADAAAAELAEEESTLRTELSEIEGRRQALETMEAQLEGLDQAPRHVLKTGYPGLRGRLLDLLDVDVEHSAAVEAALGQYVQALVVDTRSNAQAIIDDLRRQRLGRVLLLVEEDFGEQPQPQQPLLLPLPAGARFLLDVVRSPGVTDAGRRLLAWLLRGVVLVDELSDGDPSRVDLCFVTGEGSLSCGPRMEGGEVAEGQAGLVVRRSRLQELGVAAEQLGEQLAALLDGKSRAVSRADRLKLEASQLGEALQVARREAQGVEAELARCAARARDVARESEELEFEADDLRTTICRALGMLGTALVNQLLVGKKEAATKAGEAELDGQIEEVDAVVQAESGREQEMRIEQVQLGESRQGLTRTIGMHEEALRDFERAERDLADAAEKSVAGQATAVRELERLQQLARSVQERMVEQEERVGARDEELEAARNEHRQQQAGLQQCDEQWRGFGEQLQKLQLQMIDTEHRFARLEERLREESRVELQRCLGEVFGLGLEFDDREMVGPPPPAEGSGSCEQLQGAPLPPTVVAPWYAMQRLWLDEEFQLGEAKKEVQVLQSRKDRLGAVNLDAVEELEEEQGNIGTLEQQVEDLKEARRSLMDTLRRLEAESTELFEQTFVEARKNFQEIFRKLFQGGKADMFLADSESVLDAGIEIVAQPPGKQLQSINLLSGGERSLTAVAILFSLFKVRPSPFCVLDEVDAALDDTNVERFLRVLRDFTDETQFCIVTHHKRTMAECQALYGITMQRRGVSSRLAVSLQEVDSLQEAAKDGQKPANRVKDAGRAKAPNGVNGGGAQEKLAQRLQDPALKQRVAGEEQVGF